MFWYVAIALLAVLVYITLIKPLNYWKERNVPYSKPWPLIGNMSGIVFRQKSINEISKDLYAEFPDKRYNGIFSFNSPQLLIRDPHLIKQITIRDFDFFMNRTNKIPSEAEPLFSKSIVSLNDQQWRDMRATLSPSFTSSKMRFMFTLISECSEKFTRYFQTQDADINSVEMKDIFTRFTNDAIATVAFGVTVDSLNEKENEFFVIAEDSSNFGGIKALKVLGFSILPALMRFLNISIFGKKFSIFFKRLINETIQVREQQGVVRPDMIHLLLETRKGRSAKHDDQQEVPDGGFAVVKESSNSKIENVKNCELTNDDITAQAMVFFFAGFDTTSTLMCFMSYELALNPDMQERLQDEIDSALEKCEGKITYEALLNMKYLDMIVSESLRKWPPGMALDRICVKDYVIAAQNPDEERFVLEKGRSVFIPVVAIHHDPKYFPNPEKFDPERFSDENKSNIVPCTYLPFGIGPRNCIASRLALMETKILFFHLLSKFSIVPTAKTPIPLILSKKKINLAPDEGFWLGLQQRRQIQ